jgi:hypothetical protein
MSNSITAQIVLQLVSGASAVSLVNSITSTQVGAGFYRKGISLTTTFAGISAPTELGDAKWFALANPSDATNNVLVSFNSGSNTHLTITPGQAVLLAGADKTTLYLRHSGVSGTQIADLFAIQT